MKLALLALLLFASIGCFAQGLIVVGTGNVDTIQFQSYQAVNPDPSGMPLTVAQIGIEYHVMDMDSSPVPIDLKIFFPLTSLTPAGKRNVDNCVRWFNKVQTAELRLDINHQPGFWDGSKSPWPYLQITFVKDTQQIYTTDLNGNPVWLWDGKDFECWEVMDGRAPYFPNL
jgi:hypothetical protein